MNSEPIAAKRDRVFKEFEARFGAVDRALWSKVGGHDLLDECVDEIERGGDRAREIGYLWDAYRSAAAEEGVAVSRAKPDSDRSGEHRKRALQLLRHGPPTDRRSVQRFRRAHLPGGLLPPLEMASWINARAAEQSSTSRDIEGRAISLQFLAPEPAAPERLCDWVYRVAVGDRGPIDELKRTAESLSRDYGWSEVFSVAFVLTGIEPPSHLERELRPQSERPLSEKSAALAIFSAHRRQVMTWREIFEEWQAAHADRPDWRYASYRSLRHAAMDSLERVRGDQIEQLKSVARRASHT